MSHHRLLLAGTILLAMLSAPFAPVSLAGPQPHPAEKALTLGQNYLPNKAVSGHSLEDMLKLAAADDFPLAAQKIASPMDEMTLDYVGATLQTGVYDVAVSGDYAYCNYYYGLRVVNITNPANPVPVAFLPLPGGTAWGITVVGNYAYIAGGLAGLRIVDITDPYNPTLLATYDTPESAKDVYVRGMYAYIADHEGGLLVVKILNPIAPVFISHLPLDGIAARITLSGSYAFISSLYEGVQIVSIFDPFNPHLVGTSPMPYNPWGIVVSESYLYVGGFDEGLITIDISNPSTPTVVNTNTNNYYSDIARNGSLLYARYDQGVEVFDLSIPQAPAFYNQALTGTWGVNLWLAGSHLYVASELNGLLALSLADPAYPSIVGVLDEPGSTNWLARKDNYVFAGSDYDGLWTVDISDPSHPTVVARFGDVSSRAFRLRINGNYLYVGRFGGIGSRVEIFDVADPLAPQLLYSYYPPQPYEDFDLVGNRLYVIDDFGLYVLDVANPANPLLLGSLEAPGDQLPFYLRVDGSHAYYTLGTTLQIVDIANPASPYTVSAIDFGSEYFPVFPEVSAGFAYVAVYGPSPYEGNTHHIAIIDVQAPASPTAVASYSREGSVGYRFDVQNLLVNGPYLYVLEGMSGVEIVNISNPSLPAFAAWYNTQHFSSDLIVDNDLLYVGDGGGFLVLHTTPTEPVNVTSIGSLTIRCDNLVSLAPEVDKCIGNVRINDLLYLSCDLIVDHDKSKLLGDGSLELHGIPNVPDGVVTLWNGKIDFTVEDDVLKNLQNPGLSQLKPADLQLQQTRIQVLADGVLAEGNLVFPNKANALIPVTGVSVTQSGGIAFAGPVTYAQDVYLGGLVLNNLNITYDAVLNRFTGTITVKVPSMVTVDGQVIIADGRFVQLPVHTGISPGIALGTTGLRLADGYGEVKNLNNGSQLQVALTADITGVPEVGGTPIAQFNDMVVTVDPSQVRAIGNFKLFGQTVTGGDLAYQYSTLASTFNVDLAGVYNARFDVDIAERAIAGSGDGTLTIPDNLVTRAMGVSGMIITKVHSLVLNESITGDAKIPEVCTSTPGQCFSHITFKMTYRGGTDIDLSVGTPYHEMQPVLLRSAYPGALEYSFNLEPGLGEVWLTLSGSAEPVPAFVLVAPGGMILDSTEASFLRSPGFKTAAYVLTGPAGGTWKVRVPDPGGQALQCRGLVKNAAPRIAFSMVQDMGYATSITWYDSDPDDNAQIGLFYDNDRSGFDGSELSTDPISEDDSGNAYVWDHSAMPPGTYYLYAVITDTSNAAYGIYAPDSVVIVASFAPTPPTSVAAFVTDSTLELHWDHDVQVLAGYLVHYSSDPELAGYQGAIAVDDTNRVELFDLVPGRTYRLAVSAYDVDGRRSGLSSPVEIVYRSLRQNNPPYFVSTHPPLAAIAGTEYSYALDAVDLDNDPLVYSLVDAPVGAVVIGSGITWTPDTSQLGPVAFKSVVSDSYLGSDTLTLNVLVGSAEAHRGSMQFDRPWYLGTSDSMVCTVSDTDPNGNPNDIDNVQIHLASVAEPMGIDVLLLETGPNTGVFSRRIGFTQATSDPGVPLIRVRAIDTIVANYYDPVPGDLISTMSTWKKEMCCEGWTGNVNMVGIVDLSDLSLLIAYLTATPRPTLPCLGEANTNTAGIIDLNDLSLLVAYLTVSPRPELFPCP